MVATVGVVDGADHDVVVGGGGGGAVVVGVVGCYRGCGGCWCCAVVVAVCAVVVAVAVVVVVFVVFNINKGVIAAAPHSLRQNKRYVTFSSNICLKTTSYVDFSASSCLQTPSRTAVQPVSYLQPVSQGVQAFIMHEPVACYHTFCFVHLKAMMNRVAYERTRESLQRGHQVMVFVHARKETVRTGQVNA